MGPGENMASPIIKRSVVIAGHKTSISLEQPFWDILREIAAAETSSLSALLRKIDNARSQSNLSSAVRVFALEHVRSRADSAQEPPSAAGALPSGCG